MQFSKRIKRYILQCLALVLIIGIIGSTVVSAVDRSSMTYIYYTSPSTYLSYIDRTKGSLNEVAPCYFGLKSDGQLNIDVAIQKSVTDEMHIRNIRVVPYLSNSWDRDLGRAALANREVLAGQIAQAIYENNLDGVNIDLENLNQDDRDNYVDFIRILREKMPDKIISVAVAANPKGLTRDWQGSYDYVGLAEYSDYLMVMAYDEHYRNGPPGPVASASFVEKSIEYALSKTTKDKIVLGIPLYGRMWKNGEGFPQGYGVSNSRVEQLLSQYSHTISFDKATQTPCATITVKPSDVKPVIGGTTLTDGTYTIYYENRDSIKYKLSLVNKYDLRGAGSWSLGQESASTWDYYKLWLNGCYFGDVEGHWAMDSILSAYQKGWIKGITATAFAPGASLTRAQAAVMLVRMLGLQVDPSLPATFNDTAGHWAQSEIEAARQNRLIEGVGDNLFAPDDTITREQMAVMLCNIDGLFTGQGSAGIEFPDVNTQDNPWSYESIKTMSGYGIITGFPDGSFRPRESLTRAQMTVMLERLSQYIGQ